MWLRAGAAGRDAVPLGEPVAGTQGTGRPLELTRQLLRRLAPGLPGAVVAAAAALQEHLPGLAAMAFCQLGVVQTGSDPAGVVDPGPAHKSGAEDWQCPLLCHCGSHPPTKLKSRLSKQAPAPKITCVVDLAWGRGILPKVTQRRVAILSLPHGAALTPAPLGTHHAQGTGSLPGD
ncbi:uncharacterized protein LOC110568255 isoform X2 [Aotus nancymaae]|uniref:uncharacterized protein LOC110568255 isoform X2 n=1 Tax=Aotus nancymaae TaxID=37293 RepID=UPI0030FE121F